MTGAPGAGTADGTAALPDSVGVLAARWAWANVDLGAVRHNVGVLRRAAGDADVWAVVKANGYGHGAVEVARAALAAGATRLCVALVQEGIELRRAGIAAPILVLSEQPSEQIGMAVAAGLTLTVYTPGGVDAVAGAVADAGSSRPSVAVPVHVKIDTGMRRVGAAAADAVSIVERVRVHPGLRLEGVFTHLARADEPDEAANPAQLAVFDAVLDELAVGPDVVVHAANSAATLALPASRRRAVRAGIALYGIAPGPGVASAAGDLRPVLSLHARVSFVKRVAAGDAVSYGWRHRFERDTTVVTLPIGYADGVPRRLFGTGGEVLLGGRRRPIVGSVTMDQLMVDAGAVIAAEAGDGAARAVAVGDEAVLIGRQGDESITATEWADRLGTIAYEVVCGISSRVPRRYVDGDA